MNCRDVGDLAPLYLSGEIDGDARQRFAAHLAACPACRRQIEDQASLDQSLAALLSEPLDTTRIEQAVRRQISASQARRRILRGAIAACVMAAIAGTFGLWRLTSVPRSYADAARDHLAEVVDRQPRRWRSSPAEIGFLAEQQGLSFAQVSSLAPAGYWLEHAKTCAIAGRHMLHLVFTNGTGEYSIYVDPHPGATAGPRTAQSNSQQVAGVETPRFRVLVVTNGPAAQCAELARLAAQRL